MCRITGEPDDVVTRPAVGEQVLGFTVKVVSDDSVCSIEDVLGGAIVLLQQNDGCPRKIALKLGDVANVCAAEGINRLVGIPHHGEGGTGQRSIAGGRNRRVFGDVLGGNRAGEFSNQRILRVVGVLVLIHQNVPKPGLIFRRHLGKSPEQVHGLADEVVEIKRLGAGELPLVAVPNLYEQRVGGVRRIRGAAVRIHVGKFIFQPGHLADHRTRCQARISSVEFL